MTTIRLVPSSYGRSNNSYVTFSDNNHPATNMYTNTDSTTYATVRGRNSSNTSRVYYLYINGFNFDDVPSGATISSFSVKIKAYKNSYQRTGETYRPKLASSASNNSVISGTTLTTDLATTSSGTIVYTFPTSSLSWNTLKNYGSNFTVVIPLNPSSNQYPYIYIYGVEIEVNYSTGSEPKFYIKKNGTWVQYSKVYKKVNGSWVEQSSSTWPTLFNTSTNNYLLVET